MGGGLEAAIGVIPGDALSRFGGDCESTVSNLAAGMWPLSVALPSNGAGMDEANGSEVDGIVV